MSSELEDLLKRVQMHKGVAGVIVINNEGLPIRSTLESNITVQYSALISDLYEKTRSAVRDLDAYNEVTFLRLRAKKQEILVAPDKNYILIVIQTQDVQKIKTEEDNGSEDDINGYL